MCDLILARIWLLGLCPFINRVLHNTIAEARPEQDPLEEAVNINQEEQIQPIPEEDVSHFTQKSNPTGKSKLEGPDRRS